MQPNRWRRPPGGAASQTHLRHAGPSGFTARGPGGLGSVTHLHSAGGPCGTGTRVGTPTSNPVSMVSLKRCEHGRDLCGPRMCEEERVPRTTVARNMRPCSRTASRRGTMADGTAADRSPTSAPALRRDTARHDTRSCALCSGSVVLSQAVLCCVVCRAGQCGAGQCCCALHCNAPTPHHRTHSTAQRHCTAQHTLLHRTPGGTRGTAKRHADTTASPSARHGQHSTALCPYERGGGGMTYPGQRSQKVPKIRGQGLRGQSRAGGDLQ